MIWRGDKLYDYDIIGKGKHVKLNGEAGSARSHQIGYDQGNGEHPAGRRVTGARINPTNALPFRIAVWARTRWTLEA